MKAPEQEEVSILKAVAARLSGALCFPGTAYRQRLGTGMSVTSIGPDDTLKVIDQSSDKNIECGKYQKICEDITVPCTTRTQDVPIVQTRHRVPEVPMRSHQILVQLPFPNHCGL